MVGKKLKEVNLPVSPVWYWTQPSGGLQEGTKETNGCGNAMCTAFFDTLVDLRHHGGALDLGDLDLPGPDRGGAGEGELERGGVTVLVADVHVDWRKQESSTL